MECPKQGRNPIASQPEPQRRPSWENDPRLSQESKEAIRAELRALRERAHQSFKEWLDSQPKVSPEVEVDGKIYPNMYEGWLAFREARERERMKSLTPAPLVPEQLSPGISSPEKGKATTIGMYRTLAKETTDMRMGHAGEILKKEAWGDHPEASVKKYGSMSITINHKTGLVKDRSLVGYSLANPTEDADIFYGIGYFENEENFIPAARGIVSAEDRRKGAKAYFIERTHNGRKELTIIPFAYEEALKEFYDRLYETAVDLAPAQVRNQPLAAAA